MNKFFFFFSSKHFRNCEKGHEKTKDHHHSQFFSPRYIVKRHRIFVIFQFFLSKHLFDEMLDGSNNKKHFFRSFDFFFSIEVERARRRGGQGGGCVELKIYSS